jgi:kynurenine formamidase
MTDKGYYYSAYNYSAAEHGGTHIDAPVHFGEGRHSVEQIPLTQLTAPAVKIDVSEKAAGTPFEIVTPEKGRSSFGIDLWSPADFVNKGVQNGVCSL